MIDLEEATDIRDHFKLKPPPDVERPANDADNIYGPGWHALRRPDGFFLRWDGGGIASRDVEARISEEEYERLRAAPEDPAVFLEISRAHEPERPSSPWELGQTATGAGRPSPPQSQRDSSAGRAWHRRRP